MGGTAKRLQLILGASVSGAVTGLRKVESGIEAIAGKLARFAKYAGIAVFAGLVTGTVMAAKSVLTLGADLEQTRISFGVMLGSVERGNIMLAKLQKFANVTPFSTDEIVKSGKTLLAFGVAAGDVEGTLTRIGDISAGTGKKIEELSAIYGKVMAKGKMDSEALNQLTEAGIPIIDTLAKMYGVSGEAIYDMASKGQLGAKDLQAAFAKMTSAGGQFYGLMDKQSKSFWGMWSTITGQLETTAATFGEQLLPVFSEGLKFLSGWVEKLDKFVRSGDALRMFSDMGQKGISAFSAILKAGNEFFEYTQAGYRFLSRFVSIQWEGIQALITLGIAGLVSTVYKGINAMIEALNKIPGVDIGAVKEPEFVGQLRAWGEMSKDQVAKDFAAITNFTDFTDAKKRVEDFNSSVDKTRNALSDMLKTGVEKALQKLADRQKDGPLGKGGNGGNGGGNSPEIKNQKTQIATDSLTQIGLYNFGASAVKSLDVERNRLLREIANGVMQGYKERRVLA